MAPHPVLDEVQRRGLRGKGPGSSSSTPARPSATVVCADGQTRTTNSPIAAPVCVHPMRNPALAGGAGRAESDGLVRKVGEVDDAGVAAPGRHGAYDVGEVVGGAGGVYVAATAVSGGPAAAHRGPYGHSYRQRGREGSRGDRDSVRVPGCRIDHVGRQRRQGRNHGPIRRVPGCGARPTRSANQPGNRGRKLSTSAATDRVQIRISQLALGHAGVIGNDTSGTSGPLPGLHKTRASSQPPKTSSADHLASGELPAHAPSPGNAWSTCRWYLPGDSSLTADQL